MLQNTALALFGASCGAAGTVTTSEASSGAGQGAAGVSSQELVSGDLDALVDDAGRCQSFDGAVVDFGLFGEGLQKSVSEYDWMITNGPYDLGEAQPDTDYFDQRSVVLSATSFAPESVDLRVAAVSSESSQPLTLAVLEGDAVRWPADGPVLVGVDDGFVQLAFALHVDGIAAIGLCQAGFSRVWNKGVDELGLASPLDAFDLLFEDPFDDRLLDALELRPIEPEPKIAWEDLDPLERSYNNAPIAVLNNLEWVSLVVYVRGSWIGPNRDDLAVCSRTPEARAGECWAFDSVGTTDPEVDGWRRTVPVVPGQPVVLSISDRASRGDLVEITWDQLSQAIVRLGGNNGVERSVAIDLRDLFPEQEAVDNLIDRLETDEANVPVSAIDRPEPILSPLNTVEGP